MGRSLLAPAVLALPFLAATARASFEVPRALSIEFQPNHPERVVVGAREFGLFTSDDGGTTWRLGCYDAQGASRGSSVRSSPLLISMDGTVYSHVSWSAMQSSDGLCTFTESFVGGMVSSPLGAGVKRASDGTLVGLSSLGRESDSVTELWSSTAPGESLSVTGVPLIGPFAGTSFALAPSAWQTASGPPSVYVGGLVRGDDGLFTEFALARTNDLGNTWNVRPWIQRAIFDGDTRRELLAAAPRSPGLLFARESRGASMPEQAIWFSSDFGETWRLLYKGDGEVAGFAHSPDGRKIAIGDAADGLFLVDVASLTNEGSPSIERVFDYPTWAITWTDAGLYAGLNEFQLRGAPRFTTVGVSHDEGRTFAPFLSLCDVQQLSCAAPSEAASCFETFREVFQVSSQRCPGVGGAPGSADGGSAAAGGGGAPSAGGAKAMDGGASPHAGGKHGGSGGAPDDVHGSSCATSFSRTPAPAPALGFATGAAFAASLLRRRRDPGRAPARQSFRSP